MKLLTLIFSLAACAISSAAVVTDPNAVPRVPGTNVGVPGGIPASTTRGAAGGYTTHTVTSAPYYASGDGNTVTTGTITSGTNSLVVGSATGWTVGMGIRVGHVHTETIEFTNGATSNGNLQIYVASRGSVVAIAIPVTNGMTPTQVATLFRATTPAGVLLGGSGTTVTATAYTARDQATDTYLLPGSENGVAATITVTARGTLAASTTVTVISGTTFTLNANATASVTGGVVVHDDTPAIQAAITAASAGDLVYLPAGTYRIHATLTVPHTKDNISVRGAGSNQLTGESESKIDSRAYEAIVVGNNDYFGWAQPAYAIPTTNNTVLSGLTQGSTTLTVADATQFTTGALAQISFQNQEDTDALRAGAVPAFGWSGYPTVRRQMIKIVSTSGDGVGGGADTLTISPAVHFTPDANLSAKVFNLTQKLEGFGLEDLFISAEYDSMFAGVTGNALLSSWFKNVKIKNPSNYGIYITDALFCEVRKVYIDGRVGGGSNGGGFLMKHLGNCLIEDNIITRIGPGMEWNDSNMGNVIAYNFLHGDSAGQGINMNHGPHNSYNLYEGNVTPDQTSDGYFGTQSNDTIFRSWISGNLWDVATNSYIFALNVVSQSNAVIGNVMGSDGWPYANNPSWSYGTYPYALGGSAFGAATVNFAHLSAGRDVTSITRSSTTATVTTSAPHLMATGDAVWIRGADQSEYNGYQASATVTGASTYTYTVSGSPATPATGTITSGREWKMWNVGVTLTTRTSDTAGVITLSHIGDVIQGRTYYVQWSDTLRTTLYSTTLTGLEITFSGATTVGSAAVLPAQGTSTGILWVYQPGSDGFLEYNRDAFRTNDPTYPGTNYFRANHWETDGHLGIPYNGTNETDERLLSDTLLDSFYTTKAAMEARGVVWGNRTFPTFDPTAPGDLTATGRARIPAGYRYLNNVNPSGGGGGGGGTTYTTGRLRMLRR